jgi:hypothetical protein
MSRRAKKKTNTEELPEAPEPVETEEPVEALPAETTEKALAFVGALLDPGAYVDDMAKATGLDRQFCEDAIVSCIVGSPYGDAPQMPDLLQAWTLRQAAE